MRCSVGHITPRVTPTHYTEAEAAGGARRHVRRRGGGGEAVVRIHCRFRDQVTYRGLLETSRYNLYSPRRVVPVVYKTRDSSRLRQLYMRLEYRTNTALRVDSAKTLPRGPGERVGAR